MKYCSNCGAKLRDDAKFCPHCGHNVKEDEEILEDASENKEKPVNTFSKVSSLHSIDNSKHSNKSNDNEKTADSKQLRSNDVESATLNKGSKTDETALNDKKPKTRQLSFEGKQKVIEDAQLQIQSIDNAAYDEAKKKSVLGSIIIFAIVVGLNIAAFGGYGIYAKTHEIHAELDTFDPVYESEFGGTASVNLAKSTFSFKTNKSNDISNEFIKSITSDDFKVDKQYNLSNGDEIHVSINKKSQIKGISCTVEGEKTLKVKFKKEDNSTSIFGNSEDDSENTTTNDGDIAQRMNDPSGFIFENSSVSLLTPEDLAKIETPSQLRVAINEIYARHHYTFTKNESVRSYFEGKNWYTSDPAITQDSDITFDSVEKTNIENLLKMKTGSLDYQPTDNLEY